MFMKRLLSKRFLFSLVILSMLCLVIIPECFGMETDAEDILGEPALIDIVKKDQWRILSLSGMNESTKEIILSELSDPAQQINILRGALTGGYLPLLEDAEQSKSFHLNPDKYVYSDWESRTIGLPNAITRLQGALLLQQARELKYQIIIMRLLNDKGLKSQMASKEKLLEKMVGELSEYAQPGTWVD